MTSDSHPRKPFEPRYRFRWSDHEAAFELLVWPDDRYTLERRACGTGESQSYAIDAHEADVLIRRHGLRTDASRAEVRRQMRDAFRRAAEGMSALADAERQIAEAMRRRPPSAD